MPDRLQPPKPDLASIADRLANARNWNLRLAIEEADRIDSTPIHSNLILVRNLLTEVIDEIRESL